MREKTMADVSMKRDGRTLEIELACPGRANALTANAVESILDAIEGEAAEGVSLVIFSGQGRNFSSGFDMSNVESASDGDLLYRMIRIEMLLQAVFHAPFMTLALAHGNVVGAGADLMCACSMRVAAPGSAFLMPGLRFGVTLGTRRLMHRIGAERARHWLLESRPIDAERAGEWGLVERVVDMAEWPDVRRHAQRLAETLPGSSVAGLLGILPDTRNEDMATLVNTAGRPGLRQRVLDYMHAARQASASRT
jgi:enoyl-CoA hydratase/carnithine racemase